MAATDQAIADAARDSLKRILDTDSSSWSESERSQNTLEIDRLSDIIDKFEAKATSSAGRSIFTPVKRVNV